MTNLESLLNKENNPVNTAAKNYGKLYVLTAKEWIKVIKAILENQKNIKGIKHNGEDILPDSNGIIDLETVNYDKLLTFIINLGYITREDLPETPDLSPYALKTLIPKDNSELTNGAGYLTEHLSLTDYAKKTDLPKIPTLVSTFENDALYITKDDLSLLYGLLESLDNAYNPLTITLSKIPNEVVWSKQESYPITVTGDVQRGGIRVEPDTAVLKLNGQIVEDSTIYKPLLGTYTFTYEATLGKLKAEKSTSVSFVLPCYYGCSRSPVAVDLILNDLEVISPVALETVTTLNLYDGYYVWICLPTDMKVTRCKCNDFDFPLLDPVAVTDLYGTYNCYRSANALGIEAGTLTLNITY